MTILLAAFLALPQETAAPLRRRLPWSEVVVEPRSRTPADLADLGERLYGWNCMPCHGADGQGDGPEARRRGLRPRDFTRGAFKLKSSPADEMPFDDDLYRTVTAGIPPGGMPAHRDFTPDERWALVDRVKSLADVSVDGRRLFNHFERFPARSRIPAPGRPGDAARGAALYASLQCASCHGARGAGDGPAAPTLEDAAGRPMPVPDFARGGFSFKGGSTEADLARTFATGMAGTPMPAFAPALDAAARADLAAHVRTLYRPASPGEEVYHAVGCQGCHTIGRGRLVGPDLAGVSARHDRDWLRRWLRDPQDMIRNDPKAAELVRQYAVQMPDLKLSDAEVAALLDYLQTLPPPAKETR
jgi:cytochrome c oxidase cbb3-type subunit 2